LEDETRVEEGAKLPTGFLGTGVSNKSPVKA